MSTKRSDSKITLHHPSNAKVWSRDRIVATLSQQRHWDPQQYCHNNMVATMATMTTIVFLAQMCSYLEVASIVTKRRARLGNDIVDDLCFSNDYYEKNCLFSVLLYQIKVEKECGVRHILKCPRT